MPARGFVNRISSICPQPRVSPWFRSLPSAASASSCKIRVYPRSPVVKTILNFPHGWTVCGPRLVLFSTHENQKKLVGSQFFILHLAESVCYDRLKSTVAASSLFESADTTKQTSAALMSREAGAVNGRQSSPDAPCAIGNLTRHAMLAAIGK